ncbi:MAG TPA: cytochrome b/b6 domain-containing protein, partial [Terracidiphilus sp.]|nr:cytochrome b/b6 domain-containing protein [Terracidiphilus sp.]
MSAAEPSLKSAIPRHSVLVRVTHWLTVVAFLALTFTGGEIILTHPRFYLGEVGNVNTKPLFTLPIPSSRDTVPTAYGYVLPDENGWGRAMHFQAAWLVVLTGVVYVVWGLFRGHFRRRMLPEHGQPFLPALGQALRKSLRFRRSAADEGFA